MASGEKKPARTRVVLTEISSRAWEHPADKGALVALRKLKGFDVLLKTMSGVFRERAGGRRCWGPRCASTSGSSHACTGCSRRWGGASTSASCRSCTSTPTRR